MKTNVSEPDNFPAALLHPTTHPVGNFFPPWNQVDLIFETSGQSLSLALEFQIEAQKRN